jgi:hypothetical protein
MKNLLQYRTSFFVWQNMLKNVNICYVIAMTFQLHSKFAMKEHVYLTDQHNDLT